MGRSGGAAQYKRQTRLAVASASMHVSWLCVSSSRENDTTSRVRDSMPRNGAGDATAEVALRLQRGRVVAVRVVSSGHRCGVGPVHVAPSRMSRRSTTQGARPRVAHIKVTLVTRPRASWPSRLSPDVAVRAGRGRDSVIEHGNDATST